MDVIMNRMGIVLLALWMLLAGSESVLAAGKAADLQHRHVASSVDEYRLGAGDKIKVHVFGEEDLGVEVRLGSSGVIRYPLLGTIQATGMTMQQLEQKVAHELAKGYLVNPQVRVSMEEFRPFYLDGEVKSPGPYPYQPGLTVRKAISLGGGLTPEADTDKLFLILAGDEGRSEHGISLDQAISPGDIITVKQSFFFVNGEIQSPGKYPYQKGMTYRMALSVAGGLKERGDEDRIYITREGNRGQATNLDSLDLAVKPGDVITIKQSFF